MKPRLRTFKIVTDRLVIRCYKESDAAILKKSIDESIEHLKPWMPWIKFEPETAEAKTERLKNFREKFEAGEDYTFGIFNLEETEVLGSTGLHTRLEGNALEIGYWVNVHHLRKGIANETVCALTKVGFEIERLNRIEIHCDIQNKSSSKVSERCDYELRETRKADRKDIQGNESDTMIWEMTNAKYFLNPVQINLHAFDFAGNRIS